MDAAEIKELTEEALWALRDGDNLRAVALADQLIAAAPDDPVARAIRAHALLKSGAGEEALEEARRAVQLDPKSEHAHTILGIAAWRSSRLTLAQQSLERALELSGRKPGLLADYAWFMAAERGPRLAEDAAREAVRVNSTSSTAWAALGLAQFRLHRREDAEVSLRRALELDPNDPYAQSAMATLLQEKREDKKAVALAHLLEDVPGTEDFVQSILGEAKRRQVARKLVERKALPDAIYQVPLRPRFWLVLAVGLTAALWVLVQPHSCGAILPCVLVPLILVWLAYKVFG